MTAAELIVELNGRIDRGIEELSALRARTLTATAGDVARVERLGGKIEGLALVKDWLRSYPMEDGR